MLYQREVGRADLAEVFATFPRVQPAAAHPSVLEAAEALVRGTAGRLAEIDPLIEAQLENWRLERLSVIDRLVLRLAVFELLERDDTPPAVVINEALELARAYSGEAAVKFVNGVLDALRRQLEDRDRR
jgi:N utilization substance protein B